MAFKTSDPANGRSGCLLRLTAHLFGWIITHSLRLALADFGEFSRAAGATRRSGAFCALLEGHPVKCARCGNFLEPALTFCPSCGQPVECEKSDPYPGDFTVCKCGKRISMRDTKCPLCSRWREDIWSQIILARFFNYSAIGVFIACFWIVHKFREAMLLGHDADPYLKWLIVTMTAGIVLSLISLPFWAGVSRKIGTWWWW